ncbi:MAG: 4-(cytidine 5'-diphospho)-2-C-methyl-D-erythritol kinase [Lachnospiraceae bacterium]
MDRIILRPLAKVNLGLDVVGKREDGYHEVRMVMQTLCMHDHMVMEKRDTGKVTMKANLPYLPCNEHNLIVQAIELIRKEYHIEQGVHVDLKKVIPVSGGMAGGSSDAAAALFGMNLLFRLNLSRKQLMNLGVCLGADVPYCIMRGTVLAEGIGEILTPLPGCPACGVLVVKPSFGVSTKEVYQKFDQMQTVKHPDIDGLIEAIRNQDRKKMCAAMDNNLEPVTAGEYPIIGEIEKLMEQQGALKAMMSGSGPTVFGIFETREQARQAAQAFDNMNGIGQVMATSFYNVRGRESNGKFRAGEK